MPTKRPPTRLTLRRARHVAAERAADVREAAQLIQLLARLRAEPLAKRDTVKTWITQTAEELNFDAERAANIWWQEARRIDGWELDTLRGAVRACMRRAAR